MALQVIRQLNRPTLPVFPLAHAVQSASLYSDLTRKVLQRDLPLAPFSDDVESQEWGFDNGFVEVNRTTGATWVEHRRLWELPDAWHQPGNVSALDAGLSSGLNSETLVNLFAEARSSVDGVRVELEPTSWWRAQSWFGVWRRTPGEGEEKETLQPFDLVGAVNLKLTAS